MRRQRSLLHIVVMEHNMEDEYVWDQLKLIYHNCSKHDTSLIDFHRAKIGKQDFCFTDSRGFRFWVWEFPTWSIHVSNKRGINFMVVPELSSEEVTQAFGEYSQWVL